MHKKEAPKGPRYSSRVQAVARTRSKGLMLLTFSQRTIITSRAIAPPAMEVWGIEPQSAMKVSTYEAHRRALVGLGPVHFLYEGGGDDL